MPASSATCTANKYGNSAAAYSSIIEKYAYTPITLCKNNRPAKNIIPKGNCALVLEYILAKTPINTPSAIMLAPDTIVLAVIIGSI